MTSLVHYRRLLSSCVTPLIVVTIAIALLLGSMRCTVADGTTQGLPPGAQAMDLDPTAIIRVAAVVGPDQVWMRAGRDLPVFADLSSSPTGLPLTYRWTAVQTFGAHPLAIQNAAGAEATLVTPTVADVSRSGLGQEVYLLTLTVEDAGGRSASAYLQLSVFAPPPMTVHFDPMTFVEEGHDFIHLRDAADRPIPGSPFTGAQLAGAAVDVPGDTVRITLVSDNLVPAWGYRVTAVEREASVVYEEGIVVFGGDLRSAVASGQTKPAARQTRLVQGRGPFPELTPYSNNANDTKVYAFDPVPSESPSSTGGGGEPGVGTERCPTLREVVRQLECHEVEVGANLAAAENLMCDNPDCFLEDWPRRPCRTPDDYLDSRSPFRLPERCR